MQIAIISDTHSRYRTVEKALEIVRSRQIKTILHCGDIEDTATVELFAGFDTHFVLGNCDWDTSGLRHAIQAIDGELQEPFGHLELKGRKIAWIHGHDQRLFRDLETAGHFDFLFYGHSHHAEQHRTGTTLVVNPGALQRARPKTFVILDLKTVELESVTVEL